MTNIGPTTHTGYNLTIVVRFVSYSSRPCIRRIRHSSAVCQQAKQRVKKLDEDYYKWGVERNNREYAHTPCCRGTTPVQGRPYIQRGVVAACDLAFWESIRDVVILRHCDNDGQQGGGGGGGAIINTLLKLFHRSSPRSFGALFGNLS